MIQSIETGRKEDGNRSIADKIIKRLHDLEMTVENNRGRWAWELLQNAKDSVVETGRKVSVEIILDLDSVVFQHNGTHFSEKDVRGLINQISSKEVEEGSESKQTGKFGTGFLTTHLLSKVVFVEGIVETAKEGIYRFSFPLDRNGKTTNQLIPNIENAWTFFHSSTENNKIDNYNKEEFNTSFTYNLDTKDQKDIARIGIDEFAKLIPLVLAFIPEIESVKIIDNTKNTITKFENSETLEDGVLLNIIKTENNLKSEIKILSAKDECIAIASIVEKIEHGYEIKSLKNLPKLFCDFPLIGTEEFHFPVIVNSFYFNPLMERDGVWLKGDGKPEVEENREILRKAVNLFGKLLENITEKNFFNFFNICITKTPNASEKYFDNDWYVNNIQVSLREIIKKNKVVELVSGGKHRLETTYGTYVDIPCAENKLDRETIWGLCNFNGYFILPKIEHIHHWHELIWNKKYSCGGEQIFEFIQKQKNLKELQQKLGEFEVIKWLNKVFDFILKNQNNLKLFDEYAVIPNQEEDFRKRKELRLDEINDEILKKVANKLGSNFYKDLIHKDIFWGESHSKITIQDVSIEITKLIRNDDVINENRKIAIRILTEWFENNPEKGKTYFESLYQKKEKLFVETIEDKENLFQVLKSKTPLSKLAEIAKAIEDDPVILDLIEKRQRERMEEIERNKIGEEVEKALAEALEQYGFMVKKEVYGRDLVITLRSKNLIYSIEVKSTFRESYVSMTPNQANSAAKESDNYALCVVNKNGFDVNKEFIVENAKFVTNIGKLLYEKVIEVRDFELTKIKIANTNADIDLFYENDLEYKYKISSNVWTNGLDFFTFINQINDL